MTLDCAYCERPLVCDDCQADVIPADADQYRALSSAEEAVDCPACGRPLVCRWCKTPYDGARPGAEGESDDGHSV